MKTILSVCALGLVFAAGSAAAAGKHCLIKQDACSDLRSAKNANLVRLLQSPPKNSVDAASHSVIYSTFEGLQKTARQGCKRKDKVALDGFEPLFTLGSGRQKRALMYKSNSECTWVKVK
ncbi:hypothetical protein [Leisingera sp. ANG-Vp]|uniref:hypothetical protein n=1 Tax=Leisingera sp. ANG-Vp TaxID=1577896 RepID=UPI000A785247|nr:hypothetical protein [Leisingera sp. ANG-Vp]